MPPKTISAASVAPRFPKPPESKGPPDLKRREAAPPLHFCLPIPPSVNRLYATVNGKRVKTAEGRAYALAVAHIATELKFEPFVGDVGVRLRIYRPRRCGDIDNYSKSLFDALKGNCWLDDKQIVFTESHRFDDRDNPRVEVEVWEVKS